MVCGAQCVVWMPLMLPPSVMWLDMLEVLSLVLEVVFLIFILYYTVSKYFTTSEMFGDGDRPIVYQLHCNGKETSITHCSKYTYLNFDCSRESVAGVRCNHGLNAVANLHVQGLMVFLYRLY